MKYWPLYFGLMILVSCKKDEDVTGNIAPPDPTIDKVVYEDYVNRSYILSCGREPDSTEMSASLAILKPATLNNASRYQFLNAVFAKPEYLPHNYDKWRNELLNNLDTAEITNEIYIFNFYLHDSTFAFEWPALQFEIKRMTALQSAALNYKNKVINIRQLQSIMLNNYFYDQINMGASNFVTTCFQHFLNRNPTSNELNNGVNMINGINALLFLKAGASKDDFLNIFFNSDDYYEGSVIRAENDYLFHSPGSVDMTVAANKYKATGDLEAVQKDIMATNEFVGIK